MLGEYVCNETVLESLKLRGLDFELPALCNFENRLIPPTLAEYEPMDPVPRDPNPQTFRGFKVRIIGLMSF